MIERCTVEAIFQRNASYLSLNLSFLMYFNFVSTLCHSLTLFPPFMFFPQQTSRNMPSPISTKHSFSSTLYKKGRVPGLDLLKCIRNILEESHSFCCRLILLQPPSSISWHWRPYTSYTERIN